MSNLVEKIITGKLEAFSETGSEGIHWAICEENDGSRASSYDYLTLLDEDDYLTIFDQEDKVVWEGAIRKDLISHYESYPLNPGHGQQAILGYWVQWLQANTDQEKWASYFFDECSARLVRKIH
jgi:hypothetical protein